jgi:hypothetical protein
MEILPFSHGPGLRFEAILLRRATMITTMATCIAEKLGRRAKEEPTALNQALSAGTDREKNMSEANFSPVS